MLSKRIIVCLDVREGRVVKGKGFQKHEDMGDILDLAQIYVDQGVDELVFYDITASPDGRLVDIEWIRRLNRFVNIPFTVAGGIGSLEAAERVLAAGADKISINSPALKRPDFINELSVCFGSQCVVIGIDSQFADDDWWVWMDTGRLSTTRNASWRTRDWLREVQARGAGEIVLNCMSRDGQNSGYDLEQLSTMRKLCKVPLVASGGAGCAKDFVRVFVECQVEAALAAGVFHRQELTVDDVKHSLALAGIPLRDDCLTSAKGEVLFGSGLQ
ncbi:MAG: imidazole glycerol phosphate synthase subunit HisF [Proteobacteria bacterium]|nr:MAG: imidazole glycerol phosphate synthase subunit HisF [Pseudomonadota bacterium]